MSDEDWAAVIQTNLTSAFVAIRAAARSMMKGRFGRIVNISSTSGVVGNAGQATTPPPSPGSSASPKPSPASSAPRASPATSSPRASSRPT